MRHDFCALGSGGGAAGSASDRMSSISGMIEWPAPFEGEARSVKQAQRRVIRRRGHEAGQPALGEPEPALVVVGRVTAVEKLSPPRFHFPDCDTASDEPASTSSMTS